MNITCTPTDGHMLVTCNECGPLGVVEHRWVHDAVTGHLHQHGIPTDVTACECGYRWEHVTGHPRDIAACTQCEWWAYGLFADHKAHHHHLDTDHPWIISMGETA